MINDKKKQKKTSQRSENDFFIFYSERCIAGIKDKKAIIDRKWNTVSNHFNNLINESPPILFIHYIHFNWFQYDQYYQCYPFTISYNNPIILKRLSIWVSSGCYEPLPHGYILYPPYILSQVHHFQGSITVGNVS